MEHVRSLCLRDWTLTLPRPSGICQQCHHYLCDRLTKKKSLPADLCYFKSFWDAFPLKVKYIQLSCINASCYYGMSFSNMCSIETWSNSTANSHFIHSVKKNPAFGKKQTNPTFRYHIIHKLSTLIFLLFSHTVCFLTQPLSLAEEMLIKMFCSPRSKAHFSASALSLIHLHKEKTLPKRCGFIRIKIIHEVYLIPRWIILEAKFIWVMTESFG